MCGIVGALGSAADVQRLKRMRDRLRHRGPDGEGLWTRAGVVLGHTRLSVLDLSPAGSQPMWSPDGRYVTVYNGEVYNFRELRGILRDRGHVFSSATDTEVVLHAWAEWGGGAVQRLEGMYAFAIWDQRERCLHLVRDRLGIKPLYWFHDGNGGLLFASEVRALLASGIVPRTLDRATLPHYLSQQTVPTPRTLVEGVRMLPPASHLEVRLEAGGATKPHIHLYWDVLAAAAERARDVPRERSVAVSGLRERLAHAVRRQLVADVPLGAFLSGGVDSSIIVALMSEGQRDRVRTFTVAFEDAGYDDGPHARLVAERFGTEHQEIKLSDQELIERVPAAVAAQDHPSGDGINTWIVSGAARRAGLTVALSGLGGDELFGGYPSFRRLAMLARAHPILRSIPSRGRAAIGALLKRTRPSIATAKTGALLQTDGSVAQAYPILRGLFEPEQIEKLVGPSTANGGADGRPYTEPLRRAFRAHPTTPILARVAYAEISSYMRDVLLRDMDQMSMAHSLEVRVPLLDTELVEYALALPDQSRGLADTPKGYLVDSMRDLLPRPVAERPKSGFVMPFERWMRGPLRDFCHAGLEVVSAHPAFRADAVWFEWQEYLSGSRRTRWSRPWLLVALGYWLKRESIC